MKTQDRWMWCKKCQGLFYGEKASQSVCPVGGQHSKDGSGNYILNHSGPPSATAQDQWAWCRNCQGLFYGKHVIQSVCPIGGQHSKDGSGNYVLNHSGPPSAIAQDQWAWCDKCQGLFYGKHQSKSVCPAGGQHSKLRSGNYVLDHDPVGKTPPPDPCPPPPPDMVGWWDMDEMSGNVAKDIVSGLDGSAFPVTTAAEFAPGKVGGCLVYTHKAAYDTMRVPHATELDFGAGSFTIDLWAAFPPSSQKKAASEREGPVGRALQGAMFVRKMLDPNSPLPDPGYSFEMSYNQKLMLRLAFGGQSVIVESEYPVAELDGGNWAHLTVRVSRTGSGTFVTFFVDGLPVSTLANNKPAQPATTHSGTISNAADLDIGWVGESLKTMWLDEVEIFNRALLDSEIKTIAIEGKCKPPKPMSGTSTVHD